MTHCWIRTKSPKDRSKFWSVIPLDLSMILSGARIVLGLRKVAGAFLTAALLPLSTLAVRRSNFWVFGHQGGLFAGNSKYLFLWISLHRPDIRAVWITTDQKTRLTIRNGGFESHRRWSLQGISATLRAKVF